MEDIFSKEQIDQLNKISRLPEEEQKRVLSGFMKQLSPEQLDYLKQMQQPQCPFCLIAEGKLKARKIYEDNELIAALEINPVNPGHAIIFPKQHYQILSQIKDVGKLFNISNKISTILFDTMKAQGTNILVSSGQVAGQNTPHVVINVIPRFNKDNIGLNLSHKKMSEGELDKIYLTIKPKVNIEEKRIEKPKKI